MTIEGESRSDMINSLDLTKPTHGEKNCDLKWQSIEPPHCFAPQF